jgi:hypothetical protein
MPNALRLFCKQQKYDIVLLSHGINKKVHRTELGDGFSTWVRARERVYRLSLATDPSGLRLFGGVRLLDQLSVVFITRPRHALSR